MRCSRLALVFLSIVVFAPQGRASLAAGATALHAQQPNPNAQRPTDATIILGNSRRYAGTYQTSAPSRVCGELPPEMSMTGERAFVVEFPDAENVEITNVSFGSKVLVSGKTTTGSFRLDVGVKAKNGGRPPNFVLNTDPPAPKVTGTATRTVTGGTDTLKVVGTNELGETIDLTLVCKPRPK